MRLTQSLFMDCASLVCYVDDPLCVLSGSDEECRRIATAIICLWGALGLPLQLKKGQYGKTVSWIGGTFVVDPLGVTVSVKESLLEDVLAGLDSIMAGNVVSLKVLHSFTGKLNNIAGLLVVLRPFLQPLWAALYSSPAGSPKNTVWTKQLEPTLVWIRAFLRGSVGGITRRFTLEAYTRSGPKIDIGTDASPFGLGGWYSQDGVILEHFACPIQASDRRIYGITSCDSVGQQLWECLALLVALRLWQPLWAPHRLNISVRGDNVGALTLLLKMRPHSPQHAIIARELSLITIESPFFPSIVHTPGLAHVTADYLSRIYDESTDTSVEHFSLKGSKLRVCEERDERWYRCPPLQSSVA